MLAFLISLLIQPQTVTLGEVRAAAARPSALAASVLGSEAATKVEGGSINRRHLPGQAYRALFWEGSETEDANFCVRTVHAVDLMNDRLSGGDEASDAGVLTVSSPYSGRQHAVRRGEGCPTAGWFGFTPANEAAERRSIVRLLDAVRAAEGDGPLPFSVRCRGDLAPDCRDARAALAGLPLEALLGVRMQNTVYREDPSNTPGVRVRYMQPVENDRWPSAEISFRETPPDGRSWMVVLDGIDRLEAVSLRRTAIVRHY